MPRQTARSHAGCSINMTPMIDVVFQLIIFFIVTITMQKEYNEEIKLEEADKGPVIKENQRALTIEVDRRGRVSIHNAQLSYGDLRNIVQARFNRYGEFPVLIRGDQKTEHRHIKNVMDLCSEIGVWRLQFVAIKDYAPKRK